MANQLREFIQNIVNAIGRKKQVPGGFINAQDIPSEIESIEPPYDNINITSNGEVDVTDYKKASVLVSDDNLEFIKDLFARETKQYHIPYGVTSLKLKTLNSMPYASSIYIPTSVATFEQAISGSNINLYYEGTIEQWININKTPKPSTTSDTPLSETDNLTIYIQDIPIGDVVINNYTLQSNQSIQPCMFCYVHFDELNILGNVNLSNIAEPFSYLNANKINWYPTTAGYQYVQMFRKSKIKELIIHNPISTINYNNFMDITLLEKCVFPEGLTTIGSQGFKSSTCYYLEFPSTLTTINREGLKLLNNNCVFVFNCEEPPTLTSSNDLPSQFIAYVPKGKSGTWKTATNWSAKAQYIFERNQVGINVPSALLNNEQYTYSLDDGETWLQFDGTTITLTEVATIKFKNTDANTTILVGTTQGGSEIGTIANAELNYNTIGDVTIYLTIQ